VRLESGEETNPRLDVLVRIAGAFEVPVHSLLEPVAPPAEASDAELRRRMRTPRSEYIDIEDVLRALDEAEGGLRYSKRGRRRVARDRSPESRQGPKRVSSDEP
jgi:transcriptional regulator with XRE-family HTH domain